ncbi:MAG: hypothetical protein R2715_13170 [Ilumatobacteraceae bacterium]
MAGALPYVDDLVSGHSLDAMGALLDVLGDHRLAGAPARIRPTVQRPADRLLDHPATELDQAVADRRVVHHGDICFVQRRTGIDRAQITDPVDACGEGPLGERCIGLVLRSIR